ncbi:MAG: hypothetical protein QM676_04720 [Novosphingobium sp.]
MTTDFRARMTTMRDEDLIRIMQFGDDEGYETSAIEAARAEIDNRGIAISDISEVIKDENNLRGMDEVKHLVPLSWGGRIAFAILAPLTFTMLGAVVLGTRGYAQKSREAWLSILAGYGLWVGIPMILFVLGDLFGR